MASCNSGVWAVTDRCHHRWQAGTLVGDLIRGAIAFCVCVFFLLLMPVLSYAFFGFFCIAVLFAFYFLESLSRLRSVVEIDDSGITVTGGFFGRRSIKWSGLEHFELRHFALGRTRRPGWMDLKLKGCGCTILLDDNLDRFDGVLARAWMAAQAAGLGVSEVTLANLVASGLGCSGDT